MGLTLVTVSNCGHFGRMLVVPHLLTVLKFEPLLVICSLMTNPQLKPSDYHGKPTFPSFLGLLGPIYLGI